MAEETEEEDKLPQGYRWKNLIEKPAPDRLEHYKKMLIDLGSRGNRQVREIFANASSFIKKPVTLSGLVKSIDELDWSVGGFSAPARKFCKEKKIGIAERIDYYKG